jgi:uncharacterized protein
MRPGTDACNEDLRLNAFVSLGCTRRRAWHDGSVLAVRRGSALGRRNVSLGHAGYQRHRLLSVLLRIFFGEDDKFHNRPLHEAIVLKARELHLGGATVLRGHIGFGHSSHIHTTKILRLSQDLPVIVEIVDSKEKIDAFLPVLDEMMSSGLVTIEKVQVLQYGETKLT